MTAHLQLSLASQDLAEAIAEHAIAVGLVVRDMAEPATEDGSLITLRDTPDGVAITGPVGGDTAAARIALPARLGDILRALADALPHAAAAIALPGCRFDADGKTLTPTPAESTQSVIHLTDKESALLSHLLAAAGGAVARDALCQAVWGYRAEINTRTVETHIWRLRQKLSEAGAGEMVIETTDQGYRIGAARNGDAV